MDSKAVPRLGKSDQTRYRVCGVFGFDGVGEETPIEVLSVILSNSVNVVDVSRHGNI